MCRKTTNNITSSTSGRARNIFGQLVSNLSNNFSVSPTFRQIVWIKWLFCWHYVDNSAFLPIFTPIYPLFRAKPYRITNVWHNNFTHLTTGENLAVVFKELYLRKERLSYDDISYKYSIALSTLQRYRKRFNDFAEKMLLRWASVCKISPVIDLAGLIYNEILAIKRGKWKASREISDGR